jgi:thiol:disulfide interchange protein DsbD
LAWTLPAGFTAGDIVWTTPHRFVIDPLVNYGYAKHAVHLVAITAPRDLAVSASPLALKAKASWLVCADVCIPESADLELKLPVKTAAGIDPSTAPLFSAARADLPTAAPASAAARVENGRLILTLGTDWGPTLERVTSLSFYPYDDGTIEYAAPQTMEHHAGSIDLAMKLGYQPPKSGSVRGVLLATEHSGADTISVPIEISAPLAAVAPGALGAAATPRFAPAKQAGTPKDTPALPMLMMLAVLGGLILNLMPCVFPVLSIKAIGLVEQARKHPAAVRTKGLVFAAGVIASMLGLASVLLALRAGGEQLGWGFQLQSPLFVTLMIYLLLAVGLNLSGVFEVGGGLAGVGDSLTQGDSYRASFFTGVLTTLVATPCTAPFMAAAVGAALTQSPIVALAIFAALGAGLSLPYLLLSLAPWMRRALPKPGAWMDTLKQVFAFPMYASAAWLLWVLAQQTSSIGLGAVLAGAILVGFAAWAYQKSKGTSARGRMVALATSAAAVLLALVLPARFADVAIAAPAAGLSAASDSSESWQPYDPQRVRALRASGAPLLVNFTASWCLTCLVNERNAFGDPQVQRIFRSKGVTLMKGDWTNRDPAITQALTDFGRAGVPLYVLYNSKPGATAPVVLPQLLTAGIVEGAFADLPNRDSK